MADVELGQFSANCNAAAGTVTIIDGEGRTLEMATGECPTAMETVSYGSSLLDVAVMPPKVPGYGNFELRFTETGAYLSGRGGEVAFDKSNQEDLIRLIDMALAKTMDTLRLRGGPRRGVSSISTPDPII